MSSFTTVNLLTKKKGKYLTKYSPPHEHNYLSSIVIVSKLKVENVLNPPHDQQAVKTIFVCSSTPQFDDPVSS